ncbi:MAG: hypothetical protein II866_12535 [Prevotella sp.]|nr:hypothetical protein [Prevotella sp.]MBQ3769799.1 hypothetical protein [Prevotella sp.]
MRSKYDSMLPSGDSQMQGGNSETGGRQESPRKQENPHTILQVVNKLKALFHGGHKRAKLYDQKEFERGVKAVMKGKFLVESTHEAIEMLIDQQTLLGSIPLDAMRNNSNKLVNQDMDVAPLEEMNLYAECILRQVAENMHDSKLMSRYVDELTKKDHEKWQQSQICMAMMKGGETVCEYIEAKAEEHLIRLTSCMEWFPVAYHLADKVALVVFPVLGYYTGKYHLNDTMTLLWAMAFMPIFVMSVIWSINELAAYLERRKKKTKSRR